MVAAVVLGLALFVGASLAAPPTRLVTGKPTSTIEHPSIVQLDFFQHGVWSQRCVASILTNRVVVSVATCTNTAIDSFYRPENRRIRAGADFKNSGGQLVYVQSVLNHPDYDVMRGMDSDISIIRLSSFLTYGNNIGFTSILPQNFNIRDNSSMVYVGWGDEDKDVLLKATVFKVNQEVCAQRYADGMELTVTQNMICAGILDVGGEEGCFRDPGGPLYYQNILAGMMAFGPCACGDPFYPGGLTSIASFSDWIVNNA